MNTNIKTTNIALSEAISEYVDKRMRKVAKLVAADPSSQCDIELSRTTSHHNKGDIFRAEIHLVGVGKNLYAARESEDLYAAVDIVQEEIVRELNSGKKKRLAMIRRGGAAVKDMVRGLWPRRRGSGR